MLRMGWQAIPVHTSQWPLPDAAAVSRAGSRCTSCTAGMEKSALFFTRLDATSCDTDLMCSRQPWHIAWSDAGIRSRRLSPLRLPKMAALLSGSWPLYFL